MGSFQCLPATPTLPTNPWESGRMIQGAQNPAGNSRDALPTWKSGHPCGQSRPMPTHVGCDCPGFLPMSPRNPYPAHKPPGVRQNGPRRSKPGVPGRRQRPDSGPRSCVSPPSCYWLGHLSEAYAVAETGIRQVYLIRQHPPELNPRLHCNKYTNVLE